MYTVRFQLELSGSEKRFLSKSFFYANQMHNQLVRYATNRLNALFHDKEYVGARKAYGEAEFSKKKVSELSASEKKIILRRLLCVSSYPKNRRNTRTTSTLIRHRQKLKLYIREWKKFFLRMGVIFIIEDTTVLTVSNKNALQQEYVFQDGIPYVL